MVFQRNVVVWQLPGKVYAGYATTELSPSHLAISSFAPASRFCTASSVSVPRPRSRFSSSSSEGGATNTKMARSPDSRTCNSSQGV